MIVRPDGQLLHALVVLGHLRRVANVVQVQLTQEELQRFSLRAVVSTGQDWSGIQAQLADAVRTVLGQHISLRIERVATIPAEPNGKVGAVISRCTKGAEMGGWTGR